VISAGIETYYTRTTTVSFVGAGAIPEVLSKGRPKNGGHSNLLHVKFYKFSSKFQGKFLCLLPCSMPSE
jgi:hypothetical protein